MALTVAQSLKYSKKCARVKIVSPPEAFANNVCACVAIFSLCIGVGARFFPSDRNFPLSQNMFLWTRTHVVRDTTKHLNYGLI
jgi:hypothetical protein